MRASWVQLSYDFTSPVEQVFAYLAEHENMENIFPATKVTRLRDGDDGLRNGVGSARLVGVGPLPGFTETVTVHVPNERIEYRITGGPSPLRDHVGILEFSPMPSGGTHLDYRIRVSSLVPGLAPIVRAALQKGIADGLPNVDRALA